MGCRVCSLCSSNLSDVRVCVTGSMIDRITVYCSSAQELQEWLDNLQPFTKGGSPAGTIAKVILQTHSINWERQQTWNLQHAEVWKLCLLLNIALMRQCVLSHAERGRQALEHGRCPHSPVSPGQLQCPQSWALGASEDQQNLVSELLTARSPPQTFCGPGLQRGRRLKTLFRCSIKTHSLIILVRSCMSTSSASPHSLNLSFKPSTTFLVHFRVHFDG